IDLYYHENKSNCNVKLYFGGKGHTTIELIETSGEDNIYTNFLKNHGEGIHHIQYDVKCLDCAISAAKAEGLSVFQHAEFSTGGAKVRYAYVGKTEDGVIYELIESTIGGVIKKFDMPFEFKMGSLTGSYKVVK
ncbi:MAG: VOC family protein, partial [Clostridia bacterium]